MPILLTCPRAAQANSHTVVCEIQSSIWASSVDYGYTWGKPDPITPPHLSLLIITRYQKWHMRGRHIYMMCSLEESSSKPLVNERTPLYISISRSYIYICLYIEISYFFIYRKQRICFQLYHDAVRIENHKLYALTQPYIHIHIHIVSTGFLTERCTKYINIHYVSLESHKYSLIAASSLQL